MKTWVYVVLFILIAIITVLALDSLPVESTEVGPWLIGAE